MRPPNRRRLPLVTALLVALVALSGCTAVGLGGGAPYDGVPTAEEVEAGHAAALREAGSFTYNGSTTVNASFVEVTSDTVARVELDPATLLVDSGTGETTVSLYAPAEGTAYVRTRSGSTVRYERADGASTPNVSRLLSPPVADLSSSFDFAANGTAEVDGTRTYVYEANASTVNGSATGPLGEALARAEQTEISITLYVRSDGLVKRVDYEVVLTGFGEPARLSAVVTYEDVGSTTVEPPSWLAEAETATA